MFEIIKSANSDLKIVNNDRSVFASFNVIKGGVIEELVIGNVHVIKPLESMSYEDSFASSILFPFMGRLKNGHYRHNNEDFYFQCNQKEQDMAIHGLVYNKSFQLIDEEVTLTSAKIVLQYSETNHHSGFPYLYTITLTYTLNEKGLVLNIDLKNDDIKSFPFTIGWHPYFNSKDLQNSTLEFKADEQILFDEDLLPKGEVNIDFNGILSLKDSHQNNCYKLKYNKICFNTPSYKMLMTVSKNNNYLQLYTPSKQNAIAIEPLMGPPDSLNSGSGLEVLKPKAIYSVNYELSLI